MATHDLEKMRVIAREIWPKVRDDIEEQLRLANNVGRHVGGVKRRVSEQTILQLVREGLVCTPEERAVIDAAKAWAAADETDDAQCDATDWALEHAVTQVTT